MTNVGSDFLMFMIVGKTGLNNAVTVAHIHVL